MASWLGYPHQDWGTSGGSWTRQPAIIVLHSTETGDGGWPGYSSGQSAPHFTIDPRTGEVRQHISMGHAARALKNASGGVETNRGGAIQIEIIGSCDPNRRGDKGWTYLPDWSDWAALSDLLAEISDACGIPLTEGVSWPAYPGSYGTSASQRLGGSTWNTYRGVCGHMHVPENDHGDPGNIDIATILEGEDMPTADEIAARVWQKDGLIPAPERTDTDENPYWAGSSMLSSIGEWALTVRDQTTPVTAAKAIWQTDNIIETPDDYPSHDDNPYWSAGTFLRYVATWGWDVHEALPDLSAQVAEVQATVARLERRGHHRPHAGTMDALWPVLAVLALLAAAVSITWQAAG
jgi:hypothetical protein